MSDLPPYTVRESKRARHVNLKVSPTGRLEVVVPSGFDRRSVPDIVHRKRAWIEKARQKLGRRRRLLESQPLLPERILLQAVGQSWQVEYRPTASSRVTLTGREGRWLRLSGGVEEGAACRAALRRWLKRQAGLYLVPRLEQISRAEKLAYKKVIIRGQKTRWGSCSSRGTISLNYKLLFLPPALVQYVLLHELCHLKHLNHSPRFWALVGQKAPDYRQSRTALRSAWQFVPRWVQMEDK